MKRFVILASVFALVSLAARGGVPFDAGSDGSDGPLSVGGSGSVTIQVPEDGILNYTTIDLGSRSAVYFIRNSANTPVYMLAQGDVNLGGFIYINGQSATNQVQAGLGGPGGFAGGPGGASPGDGLGPGGGKGGPETGNPQRGGGGFSTAGTSASVDTTEGAVYGNPLLVPLIGGSGGGGSTSGWGGAGGGGAICIASDTRINCNWNATYAVPKIDAQGGNSNSNTGVGSGGAARLVAPVVNGTVWMALAPGAANTANGGFGRGRIDSQSPGQLTLYTNDSGSRAQVTLGANMVVFPQNMPTIRITEAAGQSIDPTRLDPVFVLLPVGSPEAQTVTVSVEGFGTVVPIRVILTPEQGDRLTYDLDIDNTGGGVSLGTANVQVPSGTSVRIDAWTR